MARYDIRATGRDPITGLVFVEVTRDGKPWRGLVVSDDEARRMAAVFDRAADEAKRAGETERALGPLLMEALGRDPFADELAEGEHEDRVAE